MIGVAREAAAHARDTGHEVYVEQHIGYVIVQATRDR